MELPQIVAAGTYDGSLAHRNRSVSQKRRTSMFEIEYVSEAGGTAFVDGKAYPVTPNRVICAKPGQERYTKMPFRCHYVHLILHQGPLYDILMKVPDSFEARGDDYQRLFERLIGQFAHLSEKEGILLQSILLELIYFLGKDGERAVQKTHFPSPETEKALKYISEHLTEDLSLAVLASTVALSPNYFHNCFKRAVGKTLREYVEEQRIKKAIDLMLTTDHPLTKIALDAGFSSQSYFSFVFKRRMNMTPAAYLKKYFAKYEE